MPDEQSTGNSEIAALAHRVATARGKLPLQHDSALVDVLSDTEIAAERELAEWIREQRRGQRRRALQDELTAEKRNRRNAAAIQRVDEADARWHRRALAARRRVANQDARLAQLYRRAEWSSRALIGVVVLGMVWAGVNVQHNLVPSGDMSDPLYWLSYGIEAMISIPIITIMVVATTAARWGRELPRGKVAFFEFALLGTTVALNAGPHLTAGHWGKAAEYAIAPVMVGVVIWLHAWVSARYAQLIDSVPIVDDTAAPKLSGSIYAPSVDSSADYRELPGERTADPAVEHVPTAAVAPRETADDSLPRSIPMTRLDGAHIPRDPEPSERPRTNGHGYRNGGGGATSHDAADRNGHTSTAVNGAAPHSIPGRNGSEPARRNNGNAPSARWIEERASEIFAHELVAVAEARTSANGAATTARTNGRTVRTANGRAVHDVDGSVPHPAPDQPRESRPIGGAARTEESTSDQVAVDTAGDVPLAPVAEYARATDPQTRREVAVSEDYSPVADPHAAENIGTRGSGFAAESHDGLETTTVTEPQAPEPIDDDPTGDSNGGSTATPHRINGSVASLAYERAARQNAMNGHPAGSALVAATAPEPRLPLQNHSTERADNRAPHLVPVDSHPTSVKSPESQEPAAPDHPPAEPPLIPLEDLPLTGPDTAPTAESTRKSLARPATPTPDQSPSAATDSEQLTLDADPGPEPRHPRITLDAIAAAREAVEQVERAELDEPDAELDGDVEIWSVARAIIDRGLSRLPVAQIADILTLADQSWTPAGIGNEVGVPTSTVARVLDAVTKVRRPHAVG
ncbi:hypothetical protein [Nocardia sp. NPDC005366]|uniref:hypothetical protein n=1 Tax=Nocardia sp. NPDC005366 TaxID=3156878 RepID=UPI0033B9ADCA